MTLKAAVVSLGSISSQWTIKAMKNYFRVVDDIEINDMDVILGTGKPVILYKGHPLEEYDCVYIKGSFRHATLARAMASALKDKTYMPIDPTAFTVVHDKLLTQLKLQQSGLPMPKTYLAANPEAAKKILEHEISYPVIMKFPQGTHGKGVMFAESYPAASSILDALTALNQPFLIQEYIETEGSDIRVFVIGDKVAASMKRTAKEGEKRANIHSGGKGEPAMIDAYTKKIALQAAKTIGAEICGVDVLESIKGPKIIEINISPGLQGITQYTGIDVADEIAKFLFKKAQEFSEKKKKNLTADIIKDLTIGTGIGKEIITNLDFRGGRILLPEMVTKETGFKEEEEFIIKVEKGKAVVERLSKGKDEVK